MNEMKLYERICISKTGEKKIKYWDFGFFGKKNPESVHNVIIVYNDVCVSFVIEKAQSTDRVSEALFYVLFVWDEIKFDFFDVD